jgi:putative SOS response-associated peptidase YedK
MCGRYYVEIDDNELKTIADKVKEKAKTTYREISINIKTNGEIYPTDTVPVMTVAATGVGEYEYIPMKWGFTIMGKKLLINARFETFTEKPTFKNTVHCLVPASGYYEWKRDTNPKIKYAFSHSDKPLYLAAIYHKKDDEPLGNFVILTREAVGKASLIHHRMPVIIPHEKVSNWLYGDFNIDDSLTKVSVKEADVSPGQIKFDL